MGSDDARAAPAGLTGQGGPAGEASSHAPSASSARFPFRIDARVWPVFLMVLSIATLAVVTFAMKSLVEQFDAASRVREEALVENGLKGRQAEIENSIVPQVVWDEAVRNLDNDFSPDWARDNIGVFLSTMAGFSRTFVLDASDNAVFASHGEEVVTPAAYEDVAAVAAPLVSAVRAAEAKHQMAGNAGKGEGALSDPIQASAPVILGDRAFYLAASLVQPDFGTASVRNPRAPVVVTLLALDDAFLAGFSLRYLLTNLELRTGQPGLEPGLAASALTGPDGEMIGMLTWRPQTPGAQLWAGIGLPVLAALGLLTVVAVYFLRRTQIVTAGLQAKQQALDHTLADLTIARDRAEAANVAKSQFLASMSHEVRTPLNGILGMAQSLSDSELGALDSEKVETILASGQTLMALLGDILDLSKIEANKLEIALRCEDVALIARNVQHLFLPTARAKGIVLSLDVEPGFPRRLMVDPHRLTQCLSNLVSNAVKFTATGAVTISLRSETLGESTVRVVLAVSDTGIGISESAISRLFGVFEQADASTTRQYGGTGLGLAITRRLARLMEGDVSVTSVLGRGSVFTLTLKAERGEGELAPLVETAAPVIDRRRPIQALGLRVLIVDDHPVNRSVAKLMLADRGFIFREATDGVDALDVLAQEPIDLVLLDAHMPVMDGRACIGEIRASPEAWSRVPVIALTAEAMAGDREAFMELGMSDYVAKPIDRRLLNEAIDRCLGLLTESRPEDVAPDRQDEDLSDVLGLIEAATVQARRQDPRTG